MIAATKQYRQKLFILLASAFLTLFLFGNLSAQSLADNDFYKQALDYTDRSEEALNNGDYEAALDFALRAGEAAAQARRYIADQRLEFRANSSFAAANALIFAADEVNLRDREPELYLRAASYLDRGDERLRAKDYPGSITNTQAVVDLLESIDPTLVYRPPAQPVETAAGTGAPFAAYYTVKNRDSLWKIAGYDFIYGDPTQWRRIYEANRESFRYPDNPDFIYLEQVLRIPPIGNEIREGTR
jgi:nucleoid-associated protein YgaU